MLETRASVPRASTRTCRPATYDAFKEQLEGGGFFLVPWHDDATAEATIKEETRATLRAFPLEGQDEARGQKCFYSGRPATHSMAILRSRLLTTVCSPTCQALQASGHCSTMI